MMPVIPRGNGTEAEASAGVHHGDCQSEKRKGTEMADLITWRPTGGGTVRRAAAEKGMTMSGTEAEIDGGDCKRTRHILLCRGEKTSCGLAFVIP